MSKNYMALELGGQNRGLKFNIGTLYEARDAEKIAEEYKGTEPEEIKQVAIITYAALLSNCRNKKQDADFDFATVVGWVMEMETLEELQSITHAFQQITKTASVEGSEDTRGQASNP